MFFSSLFHLLFIFAVARSRSHVPLGACQVSGTQSEWLIPPAHPTQAQHPENAHTCTNTDTCIHSLLSAPLFFQFFFFLSFHGSSVYFVRAVSQPHPDTDGAVECVTSSGLTPSANTQSKHMISEDY